jgi:predicted GTPase
LLNPLNIARYGFSRVTVDKVGSNLQSEVLAGIYLRFIRQVGFYLIEMNSGRLRGGADAYRNAFEQQQRAGRSNAIGENNLAQKHSPTSRPVTIGIVGQVSAGKSSLINYLTGGRQATVDVLPQTRQVQRYTLEVPLGDNFQETVSVDLLDSPGYGVDGTNASQQAEIQTALQSADMILLVIDGHNPSKAADVATLLQVEAWYAKHPNLLPPPIVAVLSHVDLIPPAMHWSPPYLLDQPQTAKGKNIAAAIEWTREELTQFSNFVVDVVAVCGGPDDSRRWGLQENVLPAIMKHLDSGQSVALLQAFERSVDDKWAATVIDQLKTGGKQLLQLWLEKKRSG